MQPRLFLMGMPGSGKSTLGKRLATKLELPFIDLDEYIETKEKKTIEIIFEQEGEAGFRNMESRYLKEVIETQKVFLLSLGGGTPCFNDNLSLVQQNGFSIYLQLSPEALFSRIKNATQVRPLFKGLTDEELLNKLKEMLLKREPYYNQARLCLPGLSVKPEEVAQQLLTAL